MWCADLPAVRLIMGHTDGSIDDAYREQIDASRLQAVTDHVRHWLFTDDNKPASGRTDAPATPTPRKSRVQKKENTISGRSPRVMVEYDSPDGRVSKHFENAFVARRFYTAKSKQGKRPKVRAAEQPALRVVG